MPFPFMIPRDSTSSSPQDVVVQPNSNDSVPVKIWIIIAVVAAAIFIIGLIVFFLLRSSKRRQYQKALVTDPYLSQNDFRRRRKMSALDLAAEEERQRSSLIRKSLASRSSKAMSQIDLEGIDLSEGGEGRIKDDWKEWEAKLMRDRTRSHERHPSISSLPDLPVPAQTRSRSTSESRVQPPAP